MLGKVKVGISNRHVHLTQEHVEVLFGAGHKLTPYRDLVQTGEFAAEETVVLVGPKGKLEKVRVLGPTRASSQVEISLTDGFVLGVRPPVRQSGDIAASPGIRMEGPQGALDLTEGVIAAMRHIHMSTADAQAMGLQDGDFVDVVANTERPAVFRKVLVRVRDSFILECHIDTDEANGAALCNGDELVILGVSD
ncbi:MAG TPA: phosphate propanoyltransferase [Firmicutes bacterium]|nr:phosphate propanoyltransferase [Bacillota bacterium]